MCIMVDSTILSIQNGCWCILLFDILPELFARSYFIASSKCVTRPL